MGPMTLEGYLGCSFLWGRVLEKRDPGIIVPGGKPFLIGTTCHSVDLEREGESRGKGKNHALRVLGLPDDHSFLLPKSPRWARR